MKKKKIFLIVIAIVLVVTLVVVSPLLFLGGSILGEMLFDRPSKPTVTHGEFPFELVYEYNGEQFTINETIVCEYEGISFAIDGGNSRDWTCYVTNNDNYGQYDLDPENYPVLYIQIPLEADYYMGDPNADADASVPYIYYPDDKTGTMYYEQDLSDVVGAKIISWKPSQPLKDNMK
jgi:hypothetical protein